jgi:hypothetical protein
MKIKKILLIIAGTFFTVLGVIGIVMPLLPTTPFLLLAAACYTRSSERLYRWLINNKYLGTFIRNYRSGRGISIKMKAMSIFVLWATIIYSAFWVADDIWLRIILFLVASGVTIHLVKIKTMR